MPLSKTEFVSMLAQGRTDFSHVDFETGMDLKALNLSGLDFRDASLEGADLRGSNLSGCYLRDAILTQANLTWASLEKADIRGADFEDANASNSSLKEAYMCGAHMNKTKLLGADLDGAYCAGTHFIQADIREARNLMTTKNLENAIFVEVLADDDQKEIIRQRQILKRPEFAKDVPQVDP